MEKRSNLYAWLISGCIGSIIYTMIYAVTINDIDGFELKPGDFLIIWVILSILSLVLGFPLLFVGWVAKSSFSKVTFLNKSLLVLFYCSALIGIFYWYMKGLKDVLYLVV